MDDTRLELWQERDQIARLREVEEREHRFAWVEEDIDHAVYEGWDADVWPSPIRGAQKSRGGMMASYYDYRDEEFDAPISPGIEEEFIMEGLRADRLKELEERLAWLEHDLASIHALIAEIISNQAGGNYD